ELLSDEVDHARIGWGYLASSAVSRPMKAEIDVRLEDMMAAVVRLWTTQNVSARTDGIPAHGLPAERDVLPLIVDALETLVLPGFEKVGVDAPRWRTWLRAPDLTAM